MKPLSEEEEPILVAKSFYDRDGRDFIAEIQSHLDGGHVICTEHGFVMGSAVVLDDGRAAWLIDIAAGELRALIHEIPFPLPYIAFYRNGQGRLRVYPLDKFIHRVTRQPFPTVL